MHTMVFRKDVIKLCVELPEYLQHDLDAYKEGMKNNSPFLDCLWGELYGSINLAQISEEVITAEHADYLRKKYLFGGRV